MTAILIEFSGGILSNSNQNKANKDLNKLLPSMTTINKDKVKLPIKVFCIRFTDRLLHFKSLTMVTDSIHVKKKYLSLLCPTTPSELKTAVGKATVLFQWKQAMLDLVDQLENNSE
ncbi:hypothetical protein DFQ28_007774 [Apophysomyces sp. BC1034]|nr:hypothetical protein DFQ29_007015 [Apophysomyces sp. BC1021]KAG0186443.1 hypothetical protein DFQ28_007774 [Apophysomyces sp. BC1034]